MKSFAILILGFVCGLLSHTLWGTRPAARATPPIVQGVDGAAQVGRSPVAQGDVDWARLRTEIRLAIRDELGSGTRQRQAEADTPEPEPTEEQKAAAEAQAALLQHAVEAGVWTDEDATRQRMLLVKMAPGARFGALNAVSKAINRNQLKVEARAPF